MSSEDMTQSGLRRRDLLAGVALVGTAGALGFARLLPGAREAQVFVFDSARPASHAFAQLSTAPCRIDLAREAGTNWQALRTLGRDGAVAGYTPWSAYVAARGWLEERGLRLVSETMDGRNGLVAWHMA